MKARCRTNLTASARPDRQRGAALVTAAAFLIVVVVVLGDASLRLSTTDLTDSSLAVDATEALFLAESALESASQQLAAGTACAALVMGGPVDFGGGDFQITQAATVGGNCRVRTRGRARIGNEVLAERTVEALLQTGGGLGAVAVGENGTILHWDGSAWSSVASGSGGNFTGVDCVDASNCMAVAGNRDYSIWDGSAWSTSVSGFLAFNDVACRSGINDCHGAGSWFVFGIIGRWTGGSWATAHSNLFDPFRSVACAVNNCYAVSSNGLASRWNGANWSDESNANNQLNGVDCPTDTDCWAVGDAINGGPNSGYAIYGRDSGGWFSDIFSANPRRNLHAVDCLSPDDCWAVGERRNGNTYTFFRRNGANWAQANESLGGAADLNGIDCFTDGTCWAVGDNGQALYWDGASWSLVATPTAVNLNDVHHLGAGGGGGVSVVRWWEIVN